MLYEIEDYDGLKVDPVTGKVSPNVSSGSVTFDGDPEFKAMAKFITPLDNDLMGGCCQTNLDVNIDLIVIVDHHM